MTAIQGAADDTIPTLLALASEGDEVAFTRIVLEHHDELRRVCFLVVGDLQLTEEAVAAAWAIAWRRLGDVKDPTRLRSWLLSVALNEARQALRRRRSRHVTQLAVADAVDPTTDPASRLDDIDLANALARLAPDDRALLALRYVAGYDSFELARLTGRSPSGTRARLARLLGRLRTELRDD